MQEVIKHVHKQDKHDLGLLKQKYCLPSEPKTLLIDYLAALTSEIIVKDVEKIVAAIQTPRRSARLSPE